MSALPRLCQGDEVLVRAIVDRVTGDSTVGIHVGNAMALIVRHDIAAPAAPRFVRWSQDPKAHVWRVIAEDAGLLWITRDALHFQALAKDLVAAEEPEGD